jgi:hypothetical protein
MYKTIIQDSRTNPDILRKTLFCIANISMALPTIFFDIVEIVLNLTSQMNYCNMYKGAPDHTNYIVDSRVFRVVQFCLACIGLCLAFLQFKEYTDDSYFVMVEFMTVQRIFMLFSMLYFAQVLPVVGFFIIGFQQMVIALVQFMILYFGILSVFWTIFEALGMYLCKAGGPFTNCKSWVNFYDSFLVMLNMVSISDQECHETGKISMEIFHMVYVFIVSLLIANYLIAVMSSVYSDLGQYKHQVRILYVLALANLIDARLRWLSKYLKMKCCQRECKHLMIHTEEVDGAVTKNHRSGLEHIGLKLPTDNGVKELV